MQRLRTLSLVTIVALLASLSLTAVAGANPPMPGDTGTNPPSESAAGPQKPAGKPIDQPNTFDLLRNRERQRLLANGQYLEAQSLAKTGKDRVLVVLVDFAGTDTFTWKPGDHWDPIGQANPNDEVLDANGNLIVGDCSNIITQTKTFTYSGPVHNQIPRPLSATDRSGDTIWTENFSTGWFQSFMFGDGVKFQYNRQDGSAVNEDFTGESVKNYYLDMSGGKYEIDGDVIGWVSVPHSTWYYDADQCPGARSTSTSGIGRGVIPGAGNARTLVKDALTAVNAISNTIPGFDWHNYDQNPKDGIIDRLWIVHAGYGEEDSTVLTNRTDYGESAVWSHSSSVTPPFKVAPDVAAGPYIVMPENGGIGVFAHESAHNIGAQDVYAYNAGETSAGFWALQADDWTGFPIGFEPPAVDAMHLDRWGWLEPMTISDPAQTYTFKIGQASNFPGGDGVYRGAKIELPDGVSPLAVPVWQGGHYWWGGKLDQANAMMTTKEPIAIPAAGASLSYDAAYGVENEWDFLWTQVSEDGKTWTTLTNANTTCTHDPGWIGGNYGFPDDLCGAKLGGLTDYNPSFPHPDKQVFDLSAFAGKSVWLRLWYMTDWGTTYEGTFIDNVKVAAGDSVLFADDAEYGDAKWTYAEPWQRSDGTQKFGQRFYLQWRNTTATGGYDSALGDSRWRYGPANTGLIVWYNNDFYTDNEIFSYLNDYPSWGPKGMLLVADANPDPYRYPELVAKGYDNEGANLDHRGLMRDAPFSLKDSVSFKYPSSIPGADKIQFAGRPAVSTFNDSFGYYPGAENKPGGPVGQLSKRWMTKQWDASVVMPSTKAYAVKAPGYNATDRFRYDCSLYPNGQVLCYAYGSGIGVNGGTGNPGDTMAQYGWHVQILNQTNEVATVKVWNAMDDFQGAVTQTASSDPMVKGSTVKVDVKATNIGSPINGLFIAPLDGEEEYVEGSAYGGAFPVTEAQAAELAKQAGVAKIEGLRDAADTGTVIGVAAMAKPGTGASVNFGFETLVTADKGEISHSVAIFDSSTFIRALQSDALTIKTAAQTVTEVFKATGDTYISRGLASTNFASWPFIYVGGNDVLRGLLQFDVSSINSAYPVDSATLSVYVAAFGGGGTAGNLAAHQVMTAWAQDTATWKIPWTTAGGDVDPMALGAAPITSASVGKWVKIDVTEAAKKWVADGKTNNGLLLRLADSTSFTTYRLTSTENKWMAQDVPVLEVTYRKP